jgi:hypothetical protein
LSFIHVWFSRTDLQKLWQTSNPPQCLQASWSPVKIFPWSCI